MKMNKFFFVAIALSSLFSSATAHAAKNNRNFIPVYAYGANKCVVNNIEYTKLDEDGKFNYINISKKEYLKLMKPNTLLVTCEFNNGQSYSRIVGKMFDEQSWRNYRTTTSVSTALVSGGLGLITGPIAAELIKEQYKTFPLILHMPTPGLSKDEIGEAKMQAAKHWEEYINVRCEGKAKCIEIAKSPFFYELRNEDLKIFDEVNN